MIDGKKVVATIEARMSSTRLPNKVMLPILGRPLLERLIERVKRSELVDEIVIAATVNPADDPIIKLAKKVKIGWYRGSEDDVLERVLEAAKKYQGDIIVELTGDCPLIDPTQIDEGVNLLKKGSYDYVANSTIVQTVPRGFDVQVFPTAILQKVAQLTDDPYDHEHVSLYIYEHPKKFSLKVFGPSKKERRIDLRLTVDVEKDLELVRRIFRLLYVKKPNFSYQDVIDLFKTYSGLKKINKGVEHKTARYTKEEEEEIRDKLLKNRFSYQPRFKAAIIGCGRIASEFDNDPQRKEVSSHAGAYQTLPQVKLVAACDVDAKKRAAFKKRWGEVKMYGQASKLFKNEAIDIVSITTKNDQHYQVALSAIKAGVKLILCEKPFSNSPQKAMELVRLCRQKGIILVVNYNRRFDRMHRRLHQAIKKESFGRCLGGIIYYSNGLINAGSHAIDLITFLCGEIVSVQSIAKAGKKGDPDIDVILFLAKGGRVFLKSIGVDNYYQFELDALFEKGRVKIVRQGREAECYKVVKHPFISNLNQLETTPRKFRIKNFDTIPQAVAHIVKVLKGKQKNWSSGKQAVKTLEVIAAAHLSYKTKSQVRLPLKDKNVILSSKIESK